MDDMEKCINKRLDELSLPNYAMFVPKLMQAQTYTGKLKRQALQPMFDQSLINSDKYEGLVDLMGKPLKDKVKQVNESTYRKVSRRMRREDMNPK